MVVLLFTYFERFLFTLLSVVANHRNLEGEIVMLYLPESLGGLTLHPLAL